MLPCLPPLISLDLVRHAIGHLALEDKAVEKILNVSGGAKGRLCNNPTGVIRQALRMITQLTHGIGIPTHVRRRMPLAVIGTLANPVKGDVGPESPLYALLHRK